MNSDLGNVSLDFYVAGLPFTVTSFGIDENENDFCSLHE